MCRLLHPMSSNKNRYGPGYFSDFLQYKIKMVFHRLLADAHQFRYFCIGLAFKSGQNEHLLSLFGLLCDDGCDLEFGLLCKIVAFRLIAVLLMTGIHVGERNLYLSGPSVIYCAVAGDGVQICTERPEAIGTCLGSIK